MTDWTIVLWNDARQIAQHADLDSELWPAKETPPQAFYETLRKEGHLAQAALIMAVSLPRLEAIAWLAHSLPEPTKKDPHFRERRLLSDAARRWIGEPDDDNRRAIYALAETGDSEWPETLLGLAVYFSGGSIAPADLEAVTPDPVISAHLAAAALQAAAVEHIHSDEQLMDRALDLAHNVAMKGREALNGA